jgi:uncharacterized membrane protein YbhN (UPF0104 family)
VSVAADKTHASKITPRLDHWRTGTFGPASELPYRRRTSDALRLAVAVPALAYLISQRNSVSQAQKDFASFINHLPHWFNSLFIACYELGTLWAVAIIIVAALVARRWRLARDLLIAGVLASIVGRLIGALAVQHESVAKSLDLVTHLGNASPTFPVVRLAVIVAVISAASPYLTRPTRRLGQIFVVLMALAALSLGLGTTVATLAALVLGWGIAALVHLAFGSPGGRPTRAQVAASLDELGVPVTEIDLAPHQTTGATVMIARDDHGLLEVRVLGRDEADAQMVAKFWRSLLYKDGGATLQRTRLADVEHEAYTILLGARSGARVSNVVVAGTAGPGAALLVERSLSGPLLVEVEPAVVTDVVLDDLWRQVVCLHSARVAHGHLNAHHIVLTADGPAITDFDHASGAAEPTRRATDVAELLCSTAVIVGDDRAIAAAKRVVGTDTLAAMLPVLQVAALSRELRAHRHRDKKALKEHVDKLRHGAAAAAGVEEPPLQELYRVNGTQLLMAIGTLIAVFALLSQVGNPQEFWDTIKSANWAWLALSLFLSFSTNFATAISLMGTVPIRLPLVRTAELQLSMSFSNLAVPAVGGLAAQVRFVQKQGTDLASAVASGGLLSQVANIAVSIVLFLVALALSPTSVNIGNIPTSSIVSVVLIVVLVAALAAGLIAWLPVLRNKVLPPIKSGASTIWGAMRSPRRLMLLVVGNTINTILYGFVLLTCVLAFGGHINYWTLLALNIGISTIASLVPIPGGGTAVGSVGMSGALAAVGVPTPIAVAAVLANQLVANFIPAVPGWFATENLLKEGYL